MVNTENRVIAHVISELTRLLQLRPCALVDCVRQAKWGGRSGFRYLRGNAFLALLGQKISIETEAGVYDVYVSRERDNSLTLLQFRGGPMKPWWESDVEALLAVTWTFGPQELTGAIIIQELDNSLSAHYIPLPSPEKCEAIVTDALDKWRHDRRINKHSIRGRATCPHCLVKAKCDALDLERIETSDWPENYRVGYITQEEKRNELR